MKTTILMMIPELTVYMKIMLMMMMVMLILMQFLMNFLHPLNYMLNFLIYTIMMMFMTYLNMNQSLYTMMILISIIGGVMIMFNYFISLINNEKSKMTFFNMFYMLMFIIINLMFMTYFMYQYKDWINFNFLSVSSLMPNMKIYKIYLYPMNYLTILMMMMLLLIMIMSFKMCTFKFKPLRKLKK